MLKKLGFDEPSVIEFIDSCYKRYLIISFSKDILLKASLIRTKYRYSYWDSTIIASALKNKCDILYSEDLNSGQEIEEQLKIVNPFK